MQHLLTPYSDSIPPSVWWENGFTEEELDWLQQRAKNAQTKGLIGGGVESENRRSNLSWLKKDSESAWFFEKLSHIVSRLNKDYYNFDLLGFGEEIQLTNYSSSNLGCYGWHQDFGAKNASRKLSIVLQLSDPEEYEGGTLQILSSGKPEDVRKERGFLVAFPSWTLHQVTPVTKGNRQSLVAWVTGPEFK